MFYKVTTLSSEDFMITEKLKDTMTESDLQKFTIILFTPKSQNYHQTEDLQTSIMENTVVLIGHIFIKMKNHSVLTCLADSQINFHWPFYPNQKNYHRYTSQEFNSKLCGTYCLYSFHLIEEMKDYDAILKLTFFGQLNADMCI